MKILSIRDQIRNDIFVTLHCAGCGTTTKAVGYDDDNYYDNVIPNMKCGTCGMSERDVDRIRAENLAAEAGGK